MLVKAKETFNYGGIVQMSRGDIKELNDELAQKMINQGLVVTHKVSYKKIKKKNDKPETNN